MQHNGAFRGQFARVAERAAAVSGRTVFAVIRDGAFTITDTPRDDEQRLGTCEPGGTYTRADSTVAPYPHEGSCEACRAALVCNACGGAAPRASRCTSGRCADCHRTVCTSGGATHEGHGFGVVGGRHFAGDRLTEATS